MPTPLALRSKCCLLTLLVVVLFCSLDSTHAETTSASGATEITVVPCTIDQPGTYFLKQEFTVSNQIAITITANNVTLDLNGHTLTGTSGSATTAHAIYVTGANVTVRGGRTAGFFYGVTTAGDNSCIEDMSVAQAYFIGIYSSGTNSIVRRCRVSNVGGTGASADAYGLIAGGNNARVIDCAVTGVTSSGGYSHGIYLPATNGQAVGNRVTECQIGLRLMYGTNIKYRDNICAGISLLAYWTSPDAIDAGNNS